jgi:hypothetical protein
VTAVPELRNDGIILNAHDDSEVAAHLAGEDEETARRFTDGDGNEFIRYTRDASGNGAGRQSR